MLRFIISIAVLLGLTSTALAQQSPSNALTMRNLEVLEGVLTEHRSELFDLEKGMIWPIWMRSEGRANLVEGNSLFVPTLYAYSLWAATGDDSILTTNVPRWMHADIFPGDIRVAWQNGETEEIADLIADAMRNHSQAVRAEAIVNLEFNISAVQRMRSSLQYQTMPVAPVNSNGVDGWGATSEGSSYNGNIIRFSPASDGKTDFFLAPSTFHRDWRKAKRLVFDKMSWGGEYAGPTDYPGGEGDIEVHNGSMLAVYDIEMHHDGTWKTYTIPLLTGSGWKLSGGAHRLADVLQNVTEFRIRGEYGAGEDHSALRNIRLE